MILPLLGAGLGAPIEGVSAEDEYLLESGDSLLMETDDVYLLE